MANLYQENVTTRSLLKKIMESEPTRSAVKHRTESSNVGFDPLLSHSTPRESVKVGNFASPSITLRSKLKAKVRRSVGMPSGSVTRKSGSRSKQSQKPKNPNIEDLDQITPRSLLRKIIQNEPEVSLIVSQKSGTVTSEHMEQDLLSKSSISRTPKPVFSDQTVAESMPQECKGGLIRRPKKINLVSLEDFEQGVENKYVQLKGSQDCFIESTDGDVSDASSNETARMSTELYSHTALKDKSIARSFTQLEPVRENVSNMEGNKGSPNKLRKSNFELSIPAVLAPEERSPQQTDRSLQWFDGKRRSHMSRTEESEHLHEEIDEVMPTHIQQTFDSPVSDVGSSDVDINMERPLSSTGRQEFQQKSIERHSIKNQTLAESPHVTELPHSSVKSTRLGTPSRQGLLESSGDSLEVDIQHSTGTSFKRAEEVNVDSTEETIEQDKEEFVIGKQKIPSIHNKEALLTNTPSFMKNGNFRFYKQVSVNKRPQKRKNAVSEKKTAILPGSFIKQTFRNYAQFQVSKDCYKEVEKCLQVYFGQVSNDLATYAAHANRKTLTNADVELLMRRHGLVTDTFPLNVLIEKHLPLDYRKLLIPCAMSGNKVFPKL